MRIVNENEKDRRLGTVLGALVGDAAGATLEFFHGDITHSKAKRAMEMPGGGSMNVGPGQITDDGELTIALLTALKESNRMGELPLDAIASAYSDWYKSEPFDCGQTCGRAFGSIVLQQRLTPGKRIEHPAEVMHQKALIYNTHSQANGALMRVTPIPAWYHTLPALTIAGYAKQDASLSHPNPVCQDANAVYAVTLAFLINHPGEAQKAFEFAESWPACETVKEWLELSKAESLHKADLNCRLNIGHVKHGFVMAFYYLRNGTAFENAICETLMQGGDTDTNAAIVGGMMGALHGAKGIPEFMKDPVLKFDPSTWESKTTLVGRVRPKSCRAANVLSLL